MARVVVKVLPGGKKVSVEASSVWELLDRLGFDDESYVVLRNGKPLLPSDRLEDGEEIVVVRVLSGG